jgi:hypothetical protein
MLRTSQSWAMRCTQAPVLETICPLAKSLKLWVCRERNVDLFRSAGALNDHPN